MVSALLTRAAPAIARSARSSAPRGVRSVHVENTADTCLPFGQGPKNKVPLAIGVTAFLSFGFALPFIAARYQIKKASG